MLVPKNNYEHLLKLKNELDQNHQSGGQIENQVDIPPPEINSKTKYNVSNEKISSSEDSKGDGEKTWNKKNQDCMSISRCQKCILIIHMY